jgi:hypothetical protein
MFEKRLDLLSLYAGLDITYPAEGQMDASLSQAISCIFKKAEAKLNILQTSEKRKQGANSKN